ncbi:MAG: hypothetical protein VXY74_07340 [SAR324 cluster bacterium]|nr:hypothetical protein [SAR324 cluster bacterium]
MRETLHVFVFQGKDATRFHTVKISGKAKASCYCWKNPRFRDAQLNMAVFISELRMRVER